VKRSAQTIAITVALLTGCASHKTFEDNPDPELRVRAVMPLCLQHCVIEVTTTEKDTPP
jgi:hypothetical protein